MEHKLSLLEKQRDRLQAAVNDLAKSDLPWNAVERKADEIKDELKGVFELMEVLKLEVEHQNREEDVARFQQEVSTLNDSFIQLQLKLRKARLLASQNASKRMEKEREELLGNPEERQKKQASRAVLQTSTELTNTMRQAVQMMTAEVERSHESLKTLDQSTKTLEKTRGQYSNISSELKTSGTLLTQIHRRDVADRIIVFCGLLVFLLTVAYILWKRTWIPGASLFYPRKSVEEAVRKTVTNVATSVASKTTKMVASATTTLAKALHHQDEL
ncbi:hypothetical protein HDV05_005860 [Chytridiales sp. JEL 0842]|nr:hypothetical protein HDV05_005860 [Chytridiales sp. JEL 0842]